MRSLLEPTFGHSLDTVRLHDDAESDALLRQSQARAMTVDDHIYFRPGEPWSAIGSFGAVHVLAHELTHVFQQSGVGNSHEAAARPAHGERGDPFEREAQKMADAVAVGAQPMAPSASPSVPSAQFLFDFDEVLTSLGTALPVLPSLWPQPRSAEPSSPSWEEPYMPWDPTWDELLRPTPPPESAPATPEGPTPAMPGRDGAAAPGSDDLLKKLQSIDFGASASSTANVGESEDENLIGEMIEATGISDDNVLTDVLKTGWDVATNEVVGGVLGFADAAKPAAGGVLGAAGKLGQYLSPLSILEGGLDVYQSITGDESNFENTEKGVLGGLNVLGGGTSLLGMLGVLPEVAGSTALGSLGGLGAGSLVAAGGQVLGSGLAGYAAGRGLDALTGYALRETGYGESLDRGIDAVLDATGLGDVMESVGGEDGAAGNRGDYTLSGLAARAMTGADQLVTAGLRETGVVDEQEPAYTQTLGWQLAEMLPSWLQ